MKPRILFVAVVLVLAVSAAVAQQVVLARGPQGVLQPIGGPAQTDSFVIANAGSDRAILTLVPNGPFTVTPPSIAISPGTSATIVIHPNATTTPFANAGTVNVFIAGTVSPLTVPVRVGAANPPGTPVKVSSSTTLIVTQGAAGQKHPGNWPVTSSGISPTQAIAASDMPWLVPQTDLITIPPNGTVAVTFNSNPLRSGSTPIGAVAGHLNLVYLTGAQPPMDRLTATVIDIAKVPVATADPPPAAAGETIAFLPIVVEPSGVSNDIFFANRGTSALSSDLNLYYTPVGSPANSSLVADAGPLTAGQTVWFPFAPSSLFNFGNGTGSVQVRGGGADVAAAVMRSVVPDTTNQYVTSVPTLRSDRSVASGDRLVFPGIEKSGTAQTDIFLQETANAPATYRIDFFDANGAPMSSTSGSLAGFGAASLRDVAPTGARSARVTNTSTTSAHLAGFAAVVDLTTSDEWTIVDETAGPASADDLVLVVPAGAPNGSSFDAWITNASPTSSVVTIGDTPTPAPAKHHAIWRNPSNVVPGVGTIVLGAGETRQVHIGAFPYVHISGPANAISVSGRLTQMVVGRAGSFGTGVAAIPASRAAAAGGAVSHFFSAIEQASAAPPTLLLAEVANKPATVRVTIGFNFPAGATLSGHAERSRDYDLAAGQLLAIPDLLRSVLTSARDAYGDLTNVAIDVAVVGGQGRVLSYLQTVEPSGDLTLTSD